jgi:hypothetical protein
MDEENVVDQSRIYKLILQVTDDYITQDAEMWLGFFDSEASTTDKYAYYNIKIPYNFGNTLVSNTCYYKSPFYDCGLHAFCERDWSLCKSSYCCGKVATTETDSNFDLGI